MPNPWRRLACGAIVFSVAAFPLSVRALPPQAGHLIIVGGGLRPDNSAVFERLIQYAGGRQRARFGILPTASLSPADALQTRLILLRLGLSEDRVDVLDILPSNAAAQVESPAVAAQIRACTGIFLEGGDQTRITRALVRADGRPTPALDALHDAWRRGAVVGGTSAGAAVQCETMISVAGLPDDAIDEGMDALDFGLTGNPHHRGLYVSRGLGLFRGGVIDQHFSQYRGRLGRLARVTIERRIPLGFGIDENTALDVAPDGSIEVIGAGTVTIVQSAGARLDDGPLGCRMSGVGLSCLQAGDRFDPRTGEATPCEGKRPIVRGREEFNGNFLIPDIGGPAAVLGGILQGLADNTATRQVGVTLKHHQRYAHGYRFTLLKTPATRCFEGYIDGLYSNTVLGVRLDVEPIIGTLESPARRLPKDLPQPPADGTALAALYHRGILLADDDGRLRPEAAMTRGELAGAIAQTLCLEPPRSGGPHIEDLTDDAPFAAEIALVVGNRLMELHGDGRFEPARQATPHETAAALTQLAQRYHGGPPPIAVSPDTVATRGAVAAAIYRIIGFPWAASGAQE